MPQMLRCTLKNRRMRCHCWEDGKAERFGAIGAQATILVAVIEDGGATDYLPWSISNVQTQRTEERTTARNRAQCAGVVGGCCGVWHCTTGSDAEQTSESTMAAAAARSLSTLRPGRLLLFFCVRFIVRERVRAGGCC